MSKALSKANSYPMVISVGVRPYRLNKNTSIVTTIKHKYFIIQNIGWTRSDLEETEFGKYISVATKKLKTFEIYCNDVKTEHILFFHQKQQNSPLLHIVLTYMKNCCSKESNRFLKQRN